MRPAWCLRPVPWPRPWARNLDLVWLLSVVISAKLHYTDTDYGHVVYDTTNGQAHDNSTTCCTTNLPHRNARAQHLDMSRCWDVANFCPLVVVNLLYNKLQNCLRPLNKCVKPLSGVGHVLSGTSSFNTHLSHFRQWFNIHVSRVAVSILINCVLQV